ncbi:MAG: hypothetical protein ACE5H3_07450, partial [Planctomycetota bacterium]
MVSRSPLKFPPALWVLIPFGLLVARFHFVCDDAFISFRYARNLASGFGLRYNPGVDPPVEGFSNFLWVIVLSVVEGLGGDPVLWSQILSIACALGLLALLHRHLRRRMELSPEQAALVLLFLATLPPFVVWSTGGLATLPFALALFAIYHVLLGERSEDGGRGGRVSGLCAGLLALTCALLRADGLLWAAAVLGIGWLTALLQKRRPLLRATFLAAGILLGGFALFELGRLAWFGDPFPNTARIKIGFGPEALTRGFHYVAGLLLVFPALILIPAAGLFLARGRRRAAAL